MARYDKYDPRVGGFRAPLDADLAKTAEGAPLPVGLTVNGRVVAGAGNSGMQGLVVTTKDLKARDIVDVMTSGEIVEFAGVAGTTYWVRSDTNAIVAGAAGGGPPAPVAGVTFTFIGFTVEATRLIVRRGGRVV